MSLLLSIPIAIIYNVVVSKITELATKDIIMKDKLQTVIIIDIISAIVAIALAYLFFENGKLKNKIIKYGLILGGLILITYTFICNWNNIDDTAKLLTLGGIMLYIMIYSYKYT
ncbi:hypothetical protein BMW23_0283 [Bodo saltans virus]|uniref:Uncharacterized protein n=1 Tax=Bodo saltans virus TaxID=2024608 RepID=A0A2H4UTS5_9VIRU|nr:hypothetical protein QJ851_gp0278 [Bodo saltans virus]ATZ80341.1 hypothetical protein BMW23_0283 [Bodo saltans virus]